MAKVVDAGEVLDARVPVLRLQGDVNIENQVFTEHAEIAIEFMRSNIRHPPLWQAFVSGRTGDPARYNT